MERERVFLPPIQFDAISNSRAQLHRCFHFSWMIRPLLRSRMDETRCQKSHNVTRRQEEERCNLFHPGRCRGESERECAREVSINPSAGTPGKSSNDSIIGGVSGVGGALWRPHQVRTFKGKMKSLFLLLLRSGGTWRPCPSCWLGKSFSRSSQKTFCMQSARDASYRLIHSSLVD